MHEANRTDDTPYDDGLPFPLLEIGDWVELRRPYTPAGPLGENMTGAIGAQVSYRARANGDGVHHKEPMALVQHARNNDEYSDLLTFTHGIIVDDVQRFSIRECASTAAEASALADVYDDPAGPLRNVAIHPFNAETGLMYVGDHPEARGKPEYIDLHVAGLKLRHKAGDTWGNEYDAPVGEVYEDRYGIEDPYAGVEDHE